MDLLPDDPGQQVDDVDCDALVSLPVLVKTTLLSCTYHSLSACPLEDVVIVLHRQAVMSEEERM